MAKWGQGDPRWIVEERADATNVNNWHWTERDASKWSKEKLTELLTNIKVEDERGQCEIYEVKEMNGEASASNRKAKLIFFYEWDVKLKWKGTLKDCTTELEGTISMPNLSDENGVDDVNIDISTNTATPESNTLREVMKSKGIPVLRQKIGDYTKALKKEFSQGMILPSKAQDSSPVNTIDAKKSSLPEPIPVKKTDNDTSASQMKGLNLGVKIDTRKLELSEEFKCESAMLYLAFTEVDRLQAFTQAKATLNAEAGGKFTMLDGNISGEFVSLEPHSKIVMKWRFKSWDEGHHSLVTLQFNQKADCTELLLTQKGIPKADYERTRHGWHTVFFQRIKGTFGYGASLF
ncbi:activator of 90 kDa heat shock protein ATPase homolog 1-like [Lytechinus variegatus]|uniref:activator of 90 kDa heat shock protein ATPase homolog 1-like n=1 Tax=Lytechinus variegatus TaxID=7654 RepID=UPI001BB0DB1A|nr:activator of 90 kDa heat shock protein ATPase homolog 1-like [Lytechinus variegatus]